MKGKNHELKNKLRDKDNFQRDMTIIMRIRLSSRNHLSIGTQ